jgi:phospholipid/cholesterol/gamma-HCH transport system substrate-binding protein
LVGLFVACGIAALFYMALQISNLGSYSSGESYKVNVRFENAGGLKPKSPVSIAGVRVGRVSTIRLDKETHQAIVDMAIEAQYNTIPVDSTASIYTAGLLGEQYISLDPGGATDYLTNKSSIDIANSAIILEEMIGKFLLNKAEGK